MAQNTPFFFIQALVCTFTPIHAGKCQCGEGKKGIQQQYSLNRIVRGYNPHHR